MQSGQLSDSDPLDLFDISSWNPNDQIVPMSTDDVSSGSGNILQGQVSFLARKMPSIDANDLDTQSQRSMSNSVVNMRKNVIPTITTIYEPKFYEIYLAYQQYADLHHPEINNKNASQQHLMTLCLNNLLPFSIWSREPASTAQWIRTTLFENPDMRSDSSLSHS